MNENTITTTNNQTPDATLRELHSLLVQAMAAKLKSGEEVKASYLDTVRKFLLDNDVRVENPQEYLGYLQGMMNGDTGVGYMGHRGYMGYNPEDDPIDDPLAEFRDPPTPNPARMKKRPKADDDPLDDPLAPYRDNPAYTYGGADDGYGFQR